MRVVKPTPHAIEQAKQNPYGWVYVINGDYGSNDAIPPHAIEGAWKVDAEGRITGDFMPNPNFKRS